MNLAYRGVCGSGGGTSARQRLREGLKKTSKHERYAVGVREAMKHTQAGADGSLDANEGGGLKLWIGCDVSKGHTGLAGVALSHNAGQ